VRRNEIGQFEAMTRRWASRPGQEAELSFHHQVQAAVGSMAGMELVIPIH
jgi:hypothetical protein